MTTAIAEFKTMLRLFMPVSILEEEEIDDRRRGKTSKREFYNVTLERGRLPLSDQQEITIMKTSVAPSGKGLPTDSPEAAPAVKEAAVATQITTTPHKESNQEEVEVSS
jgi:hypothetical protein